MIYRNQSGTWSAPANLLYAKDDVDWKSVKQAYINDEGTWKNIYNGISTITVASPVSALYWSSTAYGNGGFVMAGIEKFPTPLKPIVIYSIDGVTWTQSNTQFNNIPSNFPFLVYAGDRFVMRAQGWEYQYTSTDGINWLSAASSDTLGLYQYFLYDPIRDVLLRTAYNNTRYVARSSDKGITWTNVTVPAFQTGSPFYSGGSGMSIGNNGTIVMLSNIQTSGGGTTGAISAVNVSTDGGSTWSQVTTPPYWSDSIIFFNNMFIIYTTSSTSQAHLRGTGIYSYDGITWNTFSGGSAPTVTNYRLVQINDRLVMFPLNERTLWTSLCGINDTNYPLTQYIPNPPLPSTGATRLSISNTAAEGVPGIAVRPVDGTMVSVLQARNSSSVIVTSDKILVSKISTTTIAITDPEVLRYIARIEDADGQLLEDSVKNAINTFVTGLKADNSWYSISACCILAGARTLAGALIPLKGPVPTNVNFVQSNYSRSLGLKGNGIDKYLNLNVADNTNTQDNRHVAIYTTSNPTASLMMVIKAGYTYMAQSGSGMNSAMEVSNSTGGSMLINTPFINPSPVARFKGMSRNNSSNFNFDYGYGVTVTKNSVSNRSPLATNWFMFKDPDPDSNYSVSDARMSFYSIGSSISSLSLLRNRVITLMDVFSTL